MEQLTAETQGSLLDRKLRDILVPHVCLTREMEALGRGSYGREPWKSMTREEPLFARYPSDASSPLLIIMLCL